ncbi:PA0069 family radical SAM protein [Sphingomonas lacunae]|uniref:PA0069 family radical SAM protein n=1 Tax=Sphingomonas lacunae TaxID=2698828 RepID=A0A6M4AUM6_9SPHN|nr:PA0069 family radical SAM protein [Sphingomonas lacunae]QJQ32838.1 PA0069 family radical SAM protein [Sphingomonas lacunae]
MDGAPPLPPAIPGRGAPSNQSSRRFSLPVREADGDWLDERQSVDGEPTAPSTTVSLERPRTIIARNSSPDIGFDRSINAYRGCEHGCIYCYARPTHAFLDLSPGLDFETRLTVKPDAAQLLRRELSAPGYRVAPLAMGTNTDGYQPIEREWQITRQLLAILSETGHPLIITTKSDRILRDLDLLAEMASRKLLCVSLSVTTLDAAIARSLEPRAPHPAKRLKAIEALAKAGVPVQVNVSPVIPSITDHEMERILAAAANAGAYRATYIVVRLPHEVAPLFRQWLDAHFPDRAARVMSIIQDIRGGRDNDPNFATRMKGTGVWADLIRARFKRAIRAYDLDTPPVDLDCTQFTPPERNGQMRLF